MRKIISIISIVVIVTTLVLCVPGCGVKENSAKHEWTEELHEKVAVDIKSKNGGSYSTYSDITVRYYNGKLTAIFVDSPTLLAFKVPDKYEDGVVIFSGAKLNELIECFNNEDYESALEIINELYAIHDCST